MNIDPRLRLLPRHRRRLLLRCPTCNRQHEFVSAAQAQRMLDAGRCKFCPCVCGQEWDHEGSEDCRTEAALRWWYTDPDSPVVSHRVTGKGDVCEWCWCGGAQTTTCEAFREEQQASANRTSATNGNVT